MKRLPYPVLCGLVDRIYQHQNRRGGYRPARWCISKSRFHEMELEIIKYENAKDYLWPSAIIDRPNYLVCGIPVVAR